MGFREVVIRQSVIDDLADIAWFIESKGMPQTAKQFVDETYDFLGSLVKSDRSFATCREPDRKLIGYKCVVYKKKYTIVFIETDRELIICEFIPSKRIYW